MRPRKRKDSKYKYKSGLEQKIADSLTKQGVTFTYEESKIPFVVPSKQRNYIPDFQLPNGIFVEGKGKLDRLAREKMALVIEQNPHLDIRFLFMRDNKISKVSKTRYSDWCDVRGIKYAVSENGEVPESWVAEPRSTTIPASTGSLDAATSPRSRKKRSERGLSEGAGDGT